MTTHLNNNKLPTLYFKDNKNKTYMCQIYINETGYTIYVSPNNGGRVKEFKYRVYPETIENARECAFVEWQRRVDNDGYVKDIGDWGKYSYYDRVIKNDKKVA